MDRNQLKS